MRVAAEEVHLTATEFDLLAFLAARPGVVCTREQLLVEVWGYADGTGPRTVDSHVRDVRRKIGGERIRTVHGVGYALAEQPAATVPSTTPTTTDHSERRRMVRRCRASHCATA